MIWSVIVFVESALIILSNALTLVVFLWKFRRRKPCILLINLTIADLLVGLAVLNTGIKSLSPKKHPPPKKGLGCVKLGHTFTVVLFILTTLGSLVSLALISLERAFAVFKPFQHRVTKKINYFYGILAAWIISAIPCVAEFVFRCHPDRHEINLGLAVPVVLSALIIIIAPYICIYIKLRYYPAFQHNHATQKQMKLCRTMFCAAVACIVTSLPHAALMVYSNTCSRPCRVSFLLMEGSRLLQFSNSFVNLAIYAWKMPKFRAEVKTLLCICCRENVDGVQIPASRSITSHSGSISLNNIAASLTQSSSAISTSDVTPTFINLTFKHSPTTPSTNRVDTEEGSATDTMSASGAVKQLAQ
ncbi:hypothetical protein QZH41_001243 [Actinostola sp. cb2023]|nr:hypothetical protein QZH41_001243 [Actinostola sp. cb2023]